MSAGHGYGRYTHGCRCDVCRAAKAAYVRERRRAAREVAVEYSDPFPAGGPRLGETYRRYVAPGVKHGSSYAYYERGCRCLDCTAWESADEAPRRARRRQGRAS